jgi:hypothetical protein
MQINQKYSYHWKDRVSPYRAAGLKKEEIMVQISDAQYIYYLAFRDDESLRGLFEEWGYIGSEVAV